LNFKLYEGHPLSKEAHDEGTHIIEDFASAFKRWCRRYSSCGANDDETMTAFAAAAGYMLGTTSMQEEDATRFHFGPGELLSVGPGWLASTLKTGDPDDEAGDAMIDGFESLLLALASAGVDLSTPRKRAAVHTAYESNCNHT